MRRRSSIGGDRYDIGVHGRTLIAKTLVTVLCLAAVAALMGCPSQSAAPTLASATGKYDSGQYELALTESEAVVSRGPASDRAHAELIAGMAAFQLDRFDEAERHFVAAEGSAAPAIRGRARVMLANIRLEQGRSADAAALFDSGASDLSGADADKARRYASLAREGQIGTAQPRSTPVAQVQPPAPVKAAPRPAAPPAPEPAPAPAASATAPSRAAQVRTASAPDASDGDAASRGVFTVRAGAYTSEAAARRRVKALAADVRRAKSPDPHIAEVKTKDGDTLFAVRIGTFKSRADAESLLKRLARKDLAVGAL